MFWFKKKKNLQNSQSSTKISIHSRLIKSIHLVVIWFHIDSWNFTLIQQMWSSFLEFHINSSNVLVFVFDFHYRTFIFCFNDVSRARYWQFLWCCCFRAHWNDRRVINTRKIEIKLKNSTNRSNQIKLIHKLSIWINSIHFQIEAWWLKSSQIDWQIVNLNQINTS